ncbi:MAG: SGNH/GDSL hydrolase family protein [Thermodesulfobacteriota bacterium]|nr:SGNH/GDSL hydrolase family protein [Thermodesulfobacteriota bacterium]
MHLPGILKLKNLLLLALSGIVAFLLSEVIVRIVAPQHLNGIIITSSDKWGYSIPIKNWEARFEFEDRKGYYRFNEYHLRGGPLTKGTKKILVVGDSFTLGVKVKEEDTFVRRLQRLADTNFGPNEFQFLNGGCGGWGTSEYVAFVEDFGEKIKPVAVMVFLNADDIGRSLNNSLYLLESPGSLELKKVKIEWSALSKIKHTVNKIPLYYWLVEHSHLVQMCRLAALKFLKEEVFVQQPQCMPGPPVRKNLKVDPNYAKAFGRALFQRLNAWCRNHNVHLFVVTTGWNGFYPVEDWAELNEPTAVFLMETQRIFEEDNIPFHDLGPYFKTLRDVRGDFMIPRDGHPNEAGHKLIADRVWEWLCPRLLT